MIVACEAVPQAVEPPAVVEKPQAMPVEKFASGIGLMTVVCTVPVASASGKLMIGAVPSVPAPDEFTHWRKHAVACPFCATNPYRFPALAFTLTDVVAEMEAFENPDELVVGVKVP